MGGTGGGFFGVKTTPEKLAEKLRDSESEAVDQQFEAEVSGDIGRLLASVNDRDAEAIARHLDVIKKALDKDVSGSVDTLYGGSVGKHTYVDGLSDIDSLVLLDDSDLKNASPSEVREYFASRLRESLRGTPIEVGRLAVTVSFADAVVQLLPAVRHGNGFRIPSADGDSWSHINPQGFTEKLAATNRSLGGKVIPTIKLAKTVIATLPENRRLTGYHIESLAIEVFKGYSGPTTPKALLTHFFTECPKRVMTPIVDHTGQSVHVDEYLGAADSLQRRIVADSLSRVGRRMKNADRARSRSQWNSVLQAPEAGDR